MAWREISLIFINPSIHGWMDGWGVLESKNKTVETI